VYGSSKTKKGPRWFLAEEEEICKPNEKNQQIWRLWDLQICWKSIRKRRKEI